jgi:hypothetical protein
MSWSLRPAGLRAHDRVLALAGLVLVQRLGQVLGVLAGELGIGVVEGLVAVAVAGGAGAGLLLAGGGVAGGEASAGRATARARTRAVARRDMRWLSITWT